MKTISSVSIDETVIQRSSIASILITVFVYLMKFVIPKIDENSFVYDFVFGICFTYIIDILFVQNKFRIDKSFVIIPYNDIYERFKYMFKLSVLYKFLVVISIGSIINRSVFIYTTNLLKKYKLLQNEKTSHYRNLLINIIINFFVTLLLLNFIKFKWAYIDCDDVYLSIIILSLFSLSILISVSK
jgi:hypothetical protein